MQLSDVRLLLDLKEPERLSVPDMNTGIVEADDPGERVRLESAIRLHSVGESLPFLLLAMVGTGPAPSTALFC